MQEIKKRSVILLSIYSFGLTFSNIRSFIVMLLDIFVMWFIFFYALKIVRSNQRTIQIFKGIILVIVIDALAKLLGLNHWNTWQICLSTMDFWQLLLSFSQKFVHCLKRLGNPIFFLV